MDVSIVIVNYNTEKFVDDCISSVIAKTDGIDYEIFVVDNSSSSEDIQRVVNSYKTKTNIHLIKNQSNIGFGLANNEAFKVASGKYVFCLNPDTLLINNAIKIMFDFMEENETVGACGGCLFNKNLEPVHSFGYGDDIKSLLLRKTPLKLLFFNEYLKIKNYGKSFNKKNSYEVNHITGADLMIRKSVLDIVGYFSDKFFMFFEETELEMRIRRLGYKLYYLPDAKIIHYEGKSKSNNKNLFYTSGFVEYYRLCYGNAWAEIAEFLIRKRIKR